MKTKRVFSLASLFLAGAAVCGCQSTNPTPPIRQQPWPSQTSQVRTTQPGMVTQNGAPTQNGMVMQNGAGGVPQISNTGTVTSGIPSTGYGNGMPSSGLGGQPSTGYPGSPTTTNYSPTPNTFPSGVQQGSYNQSMGGAGMGGTSVTRTQCPPGGCPAGDSLVPPPTSTLPQSSMFNR